jgi:hypothetical protein
VWPLLPKAIDGTEERLLSADDNLWQTIQTISTSGQPGFQRFVSTFNDERKQIEIASLMAAYSHYKNSTVNE